MKKIIVLGSTGSIGESTLDVIRTNRDVFKVAGLCCYRRTEKLQKQIDEFNPSAVAVIGPGTEKLNFTGRCFRHEAGLLDMIAGLDADLVVNGISGSQGLLPSLKAIESGKDLALANKETIVMAGPIILAKAKELGRMIIPVDSEHSAIFQLLQRLNPEQVSEVIITASGGAFREVPSDRLETVTVDDALKHPTWNMGKKITIDSATMGNKGLEVIEAHHLFSLPLSKIKVIIHPQSLVHSMVKTIDSGIFALISSPDMRMPIHYALFYPHCASGSFGTLDLAGKEMSFFPVDEKKYRLLSLACKAAALGKAYTIVYNAANEIAVEAFINNHIRFPHISLIVEKTLDMNWGKVVASIDDVLAADKEAREAAVKITGKISQE